MTGEFKRFLTVTKEEQKVISTLMDIIETFDLDPEEAPDDLVDIMYAISLKNPRAYLCNDKGTIELKYQDN